jgi:cathepsin A (carboxypeptidase C)
LASIGSLSVAAAANPQLLSSSWYFDITEGFKTTELKTMHSAPEDLKNLCDATVEQSAGYYTIDAKTSKNYFYWFFESRSAPSTDPVVMWLTGGPGCASEIALLVENGPCKIPVGSPEGTKPEPNPNSWNSFANLLYVDQPAGTGFSYSDRSGYDSTEAEVSEDLYHFIIDFLKAYPQFQENDFFITGESYAGHYVPATAHRVWLGNKNKESDVVIPLKGMAVGNGLTDPEIQYSYYPEMAYDFAKELLGAPVISKSAYDQMNAGLPRCIDMIKKCQKTTFYCSTAQTYCNNLVLGPYQETGLNVYNIRQKCEKAGICYDLDASTAWLNQADVQAVLGVDQEWEQCNYDVNGMFKNDWMKNFENQIPELLEDGVKVLIYAGDLDFICNWIGNKAWTKALEWSGKDEFNAAEDNAWMVNGEKHGELRNHENFSFLRVYEAGHMVPMDQPVAALEMLKEFITLEE